MYKLHAKLNTGELVIYLDNLNKLKEYDAELVNYNEIYIKRVTGESSQCSIESTKQLKLK